MKKTQKIFALIIAVLMVFSCFSMVVFAEEAEEITLVSAKQTGENEYILEFSAPLRIKASYNIFRRQSNGNGTDQQTPQTIEYIDDENATYTEVGEEAYSTHVKLTFPQWTESFNKAKYGLVIAEYNGHASAENIGYISTKTIVGANGEALKANRNVDANENFVWIPTVAGDRAFAYDVHIENVYEEPIRVLAAELTTYTADAATFTVYFSAPVRITSVGKSGRVKYHFDIFSGAQSWGALAENVKYVNPVTYRDVIDDFADQEWSDTVTITYPITGTDSHSWLPGQLKKGDGGLLFMDNAGALNKEVNMGYVAPYTLAGINGRQVVANATNTDGTEGLWIPLVADTDRATVSISASMTENAYAVAGAPYAVSAVQHAESNTISVTFSEPVTVTEGAATLRATVASETTVALTATSNGNIVEFAYEGELPAEFAEGYGIAFAEGGVVDAQGVATAPNYVSDTAKLGWIPSNDAAYPVNIDVHTEAKANNDDTDHWTECECGAILGEKAPHAFTTVESDANGHWTVCECDAKTEVVPHDFSVADKDAENHWMECACDYKDETTVTEHTFAPEKDDTYHWTECACGAATEKIEHLYANEKNNSETHWDECECGAKANEAAHDFGDGDTCACGAKKYVAGDLNGDEEVTADDAIYLLYHVFFPSQEDYAVNQPVDFNNDTEENADDAIYLLYHAFFKESGNYPLFPEVEAE